MTESSNVKEKTVLALPEKWYFYNLKQSIDDPRKPFSAGTLDSISGTFDEAFLTGEEEPQIDENKVPSPEPAAPFCNPEFPLYSQSTLRKTISPVTEWFPFNPNDTRRLREATPDGEPVPVGHERLLFQVHHLSSLRPIYWSIPYATRVCGVHWVFSDTMTPIDPSWDEEIFRHYENFRKNVDTYKETLEKSQSDPALMRVIAQRVDFQQAGRILKADLLFSPENDWAYVFKADSSYVCARSTATSLLSGSITRGVLAILKPFDYKLYKSAHSLPDRKSDDPEYEPMPINNLILVFHGVGQKLSNSYSRINFVYAIDKLRVEIQEVSESSDIYQHFPEGRQDSVRTLVLAVNWRAAFDSSQNLNVEKITVQSLLPLRQAFSDALLDIPIYMSENRRPLMLAAAANEANRLHSLVRKHHPSFAEQGKTHIIGHSLGSLITADLLVHQPTILDDSTVNDAPFKFQTHNYFTTGSMLGVFMLLKNKHLYPRKEYEADCIRDGKDPHAERPFGCFAVQNIYNIIHQSDLLSFLVNATVLGAQDPSVEHLTGHSGVSLEPDELPSKLTLSVASASAGAGANASSNASGSSATASSNSDTANTSPPHVTPSQSSDSLSSYSSRSSLTRFFSAQISRFSKEEPKVDAIDVTDSEQTPVEVPEKVVSLLNRLKSLNENGQIDWKIPQPASYIPSHYLKMITAHFDYWSNKEIARFLAIECGRVPGHANTLPEHRVKWSYKPPKQE